jgi:hypothetical protein
MRILYLSCHSVLEYDEIKLFTELGHEVFSVASSYSNPISPGGPEHPAIADSFDEHLLTVALQSTKEYLHKELIDWADCIIVMHQVDWILRNWRKMKHKPVIWRTIGQSRQEMEDRLALCQMMGMKIVRYSPLEETIPGYLGADALIRFYKDEQEFGNWNGTKEAVLTVGRSMQKRGKWCGYQIFDEVTVGLPRILFGIGTETAPMGGGGLSYEDLKQVYRDYRVYFYTGTYPASYTLNFIEALMSGIPIVAIGPELANIGQFGFNAYEVHQLIQSGLNGFCSDSLPELRRHVEYLLTHPDEAKRMGTEGRKTAISIFGKELIKKQWQDFLSTL